MTNARSKLNQMIMGPWVAQMIAVVTKLGIPDHLKDGAKSAEELAKLSNADPSSLKRTLRALCCVDVVSKDDQDLFSLTSVGQLLRSDIDGSLAAMAIMNCDKSHWLPWAAAEKAVRSGKPVARDVFGTSFWDFLNQNKVEHDNFNRAMTDTSYGISAVIANSFDFGQYNKVVDVGGGQGALLVEVLKKHGNVEGVLFDLPSVIDEAKIPEDLSSRISLEKGSFLDTAPSGGDIYLLKHIIHDWDDSQSLDILKNVRNAIQPEGRVLVLEMVLDETSSHFASWLDLNMMVILGGRERTKEDFASLLDQSGFELEDVVKTDTHMSIVIGKPV